MWHQERHSPGDTMWKMIRKGLLSIWKGLQEGVSIREKLEGGAAGSREEAGRVSPAGETAGAKALGWEVIRVFEDARSPVSQGGCGVRYDGT